MKNNQKGFAPLLVIAIVAIVALSGAGVWHAASKKKSVEAPVQSQGEEHRSDVAASSTAILGNATSSEAKSKNDDRRSGPIFSGDQICTFVIKDANTDSNGTFYISNESVRGDFSSVNHAVNVVIKSHTVIKDGFSYTWTDAANIGYKVPVSNKDTVATLNGMVSASMNGAQADYECKTWAPDGSKFTVPASVSFMEAPKAQ